MDNTVDKLVPCADDGEGPDDSAELEDWLAGIRVALDQPELIPHAHRTAGR